MLELYKDYLQEEWAADGSLQSVRLHAPDDFNFGYDIIDRIALAEPERRAMVWCDDYGWEETFTFADMMRRSNQTANLLLSLGIKKGDAVLLLLRRHYEYWFCILALHKIGAIAIPATDQLTAKDIAYRIDAAGVSAVICTAEGEAAASVDAAAEKCPTLRTKILARGEREGWLSYHRELERQSDQLERIPNRASDPMLLFFTSGTTGHAQDGAPRLPLSPGAHRHRQGVAPGGAGRAAPLGGGHRLGQGLLGQNLRPVDHGGGHLCLRLHPLCPQRPAPPD